MKLTYATVVRGYALLTLFGAITAMALVIVGLVWGAFEVGFTGTVVLALSSVVAVRWMELAEQERRRAALQSEQPE